MVNLLNTIFRKKYYPLNKIEISRDNLLHNFNYLISLYPDSLISPVFKSNAYGHGISKVAPLLDSLSCPFFCVDSVFEALQIKKLKLKTPVLIMGYIDPKSLLIKKYDFSYAVWNLEYAKAINKYQPGSEIHIFVDTGMHREGVILEELEEFIEELKKLKNLKIMGLMSHLASADNPKDPQNKIQYKNFESALKICASKQLRLQYRHLLASSGRLCLPQARSNINRIGIALYGIDPVEKFPELKPVLKLTTKIVQIKKLKKGEKVGYSGTFAAKTDMVMGILPLGYNDGLDRRLSNKGIVLVSYVPCPIIGMISMNVTAIDISSVENPQVGDEVIVYSDNPTDKNSIQNTAKICNTIPYEILVNISESTRREIV